MIIFRFTIIAFFATILIGKEIVYSNKQLPIRKLSKQPTMIRYQIQYCLGLALGFSVNILLATRGRVAFLNLPRVGMATMVNSLSAIVHIMVEQVNFQMAQINSIPGALVCGSGGNLKILIRQRIDQSQLGIKLLKMSA